MALFCKINTSVVLYYISWKHYKPFWQLFILDMDHTLEKDWQLDWIRIELKIGFKSWGRVLRRNPDKCLKIFLLAIQSHLLHSLFLEISISSNSRNLFPFLHFSYCTQSRRKEENLIEKQKPYPLPYGLRNPYRNLKSENSPEPQRNCTFMNSASS